MLTIQSLSKIYRTKLLETHALREISFQINTGEFVAITGPSGSGKTTLLNILGLLEEPSSGRFELDGINVMGLNDDQRARVRNQKLGFVFQSFNLIPELNVYDNVDVPLRYRGLGKSDREQRIQSALERVGLGGRVHHMPSELSGGQQQRVAIARALAGSPKLLLADEPTGNLDTAMARATMALLEEINQAGTTIAMVTHDPELARRAHRNVHIVDGQIVDIMARTNNALAAASERAEA